MTGIIGAMQIEVDTLIGMLSESVSNAYSGITFVSGNLNGNNVVIAKCGVGKVFAAVCAQTMILKYNVNAIINTGVGGTLCPELGIMDVAVADFVVQHDMDTSALGDPAGMISGINIIKIPASKALSSALLTNAKKLGINTVNATIASGDVFVSTSVQKRRIHDAFGAAVCEMEGAAIGQVCYINNVDFAVLRTVSDAADGSSPSDFPAFAASAAKQSANIIIEFFRGMWQAKEATWETS